MQKIFKSSPRLIYDVLLNKFKGGGGGGGGALLKVLKTSQLWERFQTPQVITGLVKKY